MTTEEIAKRLVELCRQGEFETAQKELFADDAISIEPHGTSAFDKETKGLSAMIEKGYEFQAMVEELHGRNISDPLIAGNYVALTMSFDVTIKGKKRSNSEEICVYQVKDGKIISEQFFM